MTIEINLLDGELVSGPMLFLMMILVMIIWDKKRQRRTRDTAIKGEDQNHVG